MIHDTILIIDLGSEHNSSLARQIRELGVYSQVAAHDIDTKDLEEIKGLKGIILHCGKNRVVDGVEIDVGDHVFEYGLPVLGIGYESTGQELIDEDTLIEDFVFDICRAQEGWNMESFVREEIAAVREKVGDRKVLLGLSGGVDSTVVAALLVKAIGRQLICVHVDNGLMRKNESEEVIDYFRPDLGGNLIYVDAGERFLTKLRGVADPEEKRKIIGEEFVRVFEEEAEKLDGIDFLAQGTIYADIVESGTKTAKTIKSHHNVGGLPDDMTFELLEPVKYLFKDEVREAGLVLGVPEDMVFRQPFPGPGFGVRCLGAISRERLDILSESDAILREEFAGAGLHKTVWQYFTVVPEFKSVGVRDGERTYDYPVILRAVNSVDAMTADIELVDWPLLQKITDRILAEVAGVNRVLYDLTPKPPGTIEWE